MQSGISVLISFYMVDFVLKIPTVSCIFYESGIKTEEWGLHILSWNRATLCYKLVSIRSKETLKSSAYLIEIKERNNLY